MAGGSLREVAIQDNGGVSSRGRNVALFPCAEWLTWWVRDRRIFAGFQKLLVSLEEAGPGDGAVTSVQGVCEVTMVRDVAEVEAHAGDLAWVSALAVEAFGLVEAELGCDLEGLRREAASLADATFPLRVGLTRVATRMPRGWRGEVGLLLEPGSTRVVLSLEHDETREEYVLAQVAGPLWLEEDFPVRKVVVMDGVITCKDRSGSQQSTTTM